MARLVVNKTKIVLFTFPGPSNMMNTATKVLKCMNIAKARGKYIARASLYSITVGYGMSYSILYENVWQGVCQLPVMLNTELFIFKCLANTNCAIQYIILFMFKCLARALSVPYRSCLGR